MVPGRLWSLAVLGAAVLLASALQAPMQSGTTAARMAGSVTPDPPQSPMAPSASEPIAPALANGESRVIVASRDPSIVPNEGVLTNVTAWSSSPLAANTSFQVGGEESIGAFTAVFGLFENTQFSARPFFSVFNSSTDAQIRLIYWPTVPIIPGNSYDFRLSSNGSTTWTLLLNGEVFAENQSAASFDFGTAQATLSTGVGFSEVAFAQNSSPIPPKISVPVAFAVLQSGTWTVPNGGYLFLSPASPPPWGVVGRAQAPSLAPAELLTGTAVPLTANNTTLWSGGAIPVDLGLRLDTSTVVGTASFGLEVSVTTTGPPSQPVGNVTVFLRDTVGSLFSNASALTLPNGTVSVLAVAGNVSQTTNDVVSAAVTLLGYTGAAGASLVVTPPVQLLLSVEPTSVDLGTPHTEPLTIRATTLEGAAAASIELQVGITGPATISPVEGATDGGGLLNISLTVIGKPGQVALSVSVAEAGVWGHYSVILGNLTATTFLGQFGPLILAVILTALVVVGVWVVWRWERGRRPMPPMGFTPDPANSPRSEPAAAPVSRTPPEGGSP